MAAASAVKDEHSETGHSENQNNLPLKVEGNQDCFKTTLAVEKQGIPSDSGKVQEKSEKAEPTKKFVDAPLPATNAWTKRSSSLTSAAETTQAPQVSELKKEVPVNDKAAPQGNAVAPQGNAVAPQGNAVAPQGNAVPHKTGKGNKNPVPNADSAKNEKPKAQKSKTELNGNKQVDNNQKPKKFGEDFIEAPLPTVNPWKLPTSTGASGLVAPVGIKQDTTPAAAVAAVVSQSSYSKDLWTHEKPFQADSKTDSKPLENSVNEVEARSATSPVLVDENWPTLHEVKVTEPNQMMPPKATKSPRVKAASAATVTATGPTPVVSGVASAPVDSVEVSPSPSGHAVNSAESQEITQTQNDSGGDDSSKENKESSTNDDDTSNAVRSKKGTKPKWQRMEIEHPKPDRRNRRSRSQGRGYSPSRRGAKPAGARVNKPNSRRSEAGPDSQNWRANMTQQGTTTPTEVVTTTTVATDIPAATDSAQATVIGEHLRGGPGMNFTGNRNPRGRGGLRGNGLRRGGGRGRGIIRDTKSPPFQATVNANSWNHERVFPTITADPEAIPVPWSQGFNRVHSIPRVPPINQVVLGFEANYFLQEQLLNILGQASVYYDVTPTNTYPGPLNTLKHQVEYYFSEDNLVKDLYLRKKMDKHGWVELRLVLSFNKVKELKADYRSLIQAIRGSDKLELSANANYVRTLNYPEIWPIDPDFTGQMPPVEVQRIAAMSTLHSDAPEFVPGKPFVLRNLASSVPQSSIPVTRKDDVVPNSRYQEAGHEEQNDSPVCDATSNLATIPPPMLSSR